MSTESKDEPLNRPEKPTSSSETGPRDPRAWLSTLAAALKEARDLLAQLDDGTASADLIDRISRLQKDIAASQDGEIEALEQDHPIWIELAHWLDNAGKP